MIELLSKISDGGIWQPCNAVFQTSLLKNLWYLKARQKLTFTFMMLVVIYMLFVILNGYGELIQEYTWPATYAI